MFDYWKSLSEFIANFDLSLSEVSEQEPKGNKQKEPTKQEAKDKDIKEE